MAKSTETLSKTLVLTRTYAAPKALVFACWTKAEHLAAWWGPHQFDAPMVETDPRPGGVFKLDMRGPDGSVNHLVGRFEEVVQDEKVVFAVEAFFGPKGPALEGRNEIVLTEQDGVTTMTLTAAVTVAPSLKAGIDGMNQGWSESLEKLAALIAKEARP